MRLIKYLFIILIPLISVQCQTGKEKQISILSFNILQGGHNASNVGFYPEQYNGSRFDEISNIILALDPDIIGIQEDTKTDSLLNALGKGWYRCKNIYSRYKMKHLASSGPMVNACRVYLPNNDSLVFINTHWWPAGGLPYVEKKYSKAIFPRT